MKPLHALMLVLGLAALPPAMAQWQWLDSSGKKVFSDRPPPADVPERSILRRPSGSRAPAPAAAPATAATANPAANAALPKLAGTDKELEERRRQAEEAETAKRKAQEEASARTRADNCARARQAKAQYDSGARIARTNANGEREILDDAARTSETRRLQDIIASDCG